MEMNELLSMESILFFFFSFHRSMLLFRLSAEFSIALID